MIATLTDLFRVSDEFCIRWVLTLVHFTWQGLVIGLVAACGSWMFRSYSAVVRYNVLTVALLCMPVCVATTFLSIEVDSHRVGEASETSVSPFANAEPPQIDDPHLTTDPPENSVPAAVPTTPKPANPINDAPGQPTYSLRAFARPVALLYVMGACFFLIRLGAGLWGGHRLRTTAERIVDPELMEMITDQARLIGLRLVPIVAYCERVAVPTVIGVIKPIVLLPTVLVNIDTKHLATIIGHEFAHIRRADLMMNLIQRLVESLLFFHPVTWYVSRRIKTERELCCDDLVVATGQRLPYAAALLEMAELCVVRRNSGGAALAADGANASELEERIRRLIDAKSIPRIRMTRVGLTAFLLCAIIALAAPRTMQTFATANEPGHPQQTAPDNEREFESPDPTDESNVDPRSLTQAIEAINRAVAHHPIANGAEPLTLKTVFAGIRAAGRTLDFSPEDIEVTNEIVQSESLPDGASLRHFVRYTDGETVQVGSYVRLVLERKSEPPLIIPIRAHVDFARPCTQLERQFRQQVEESGMPTLGRMVSFFGQDAERTDVVSDQPLANALAKKASAAVQAKDVESFLALFHWRGVGEKSPLRAFVRTEVDDLIRKNANQHALFPRRFLGEVRHHQGFREFESNAPVKGYIALHGDDTHDQGLKFEYGEIDGEARFVCYIVRDDRTSDFIGKKLSSNISVSGAMSARPDGSYESMTFLEAPEELSSLRQANHEIWRFKPRPTKNPDVNAIPVKSPDTQDTPRVSEPVAERSPLSASVHEVNVQCTDSSGTPMGGAEVHLFQFTGGNDRRYEHIGPMTSDADGKVSFRGAQFTNALGDFDRWIYARIPGKHVGVARSRRTRRSDDIYNAEATVRMFPSRSVDGTVSVPSGFDPREVTVSVRSMHVMTGDGDYDYESFPREIHFRGLDKSLPEIFERRPNADGTIRFDDVPARGHLYLVTSGVGLGEAQWWNGWKPATFDTPIAIDVAEERRFFGQVLSPNGAPVKDIGVHARISSRSSYLSTFRTTTDASGEFTLVGLPDKEFSITVHDPQERWSFRPRHKERAELGNGRELNLQMESTIRITGKVVDTDGSPVPLAAISAIVDAKDGAGLDSAMTDKLGFFELQLPPGKAKLYFNSLPSGFEYPRPQVIKRLEIQVNQEQVEALNFVLQRTPEPDN